MATAIPVEPAASDVADASKLPLPVIPPTDAEAKHALAARLTELGSGQLEIEFHPTTFMSGDMCDGVRHRRADVTELMSRPLEHRKAIEDQLMKDLRGAIDFYSMLTLKVLSGDFDAGFEPVVDVLFNGATKQSTPVRGVRWMPNAGDTGNLRTKPRDH